MVLAWQDGVGTAVEGAGGRRSCRCGKRSVAGHGGVWRMMERRVDGEDI